MHSTSDSPLIPSFGLESHEADPNHGRSDSRRLSAHGSRQRGTPASPDDATGERVHTSAKVLDKPSDNGTNVEKAERRRERVNLSIPLSFR